ncbi:MAG TPA: sensor histidine kinase N-terminal domain-containing protein [Burkholderiaceae bacterium]|nr:sensor histidine kinase N-terminal domain-containing protein [Burkholderiaceae bacterium]
MNEALGSLRGNLLRWLLGSLTLLLIANTVNIYRNAVDAANSAYDRTLLASARMVAENLRVVDGRVTLAIPYSAVDMLESDIKGRLYYRVLDPHGTFVAGWDDLPPVRTDVPLSPAYAALVRFYEDEYHGAAVRIATLMQPVVEGGFSGVVTIQFAEDFQSRRALIRNILVEALLGQGLLILAAVLLVLWAIHTALRPLRRFSEELAARNSDDLAPFERGVVHREVRPLIDALNSYMARLRNLIELRKRFIEYAAHQLRTPLAVLKTQAGVAIRSQPSGEVDEAVRAMEGTVDQATRLANQLLTLTRAEHGFAVATPQAVDLLALARELALEWFERARARGIDLGFDGPQGADGTDAGAPHVVQGDPLLLREMLSNLIDNAVRYCRAGDSITVRLRAGDALRLEVEDTGPGIPAAERERVFGRFYRVPGQQAPGSGLGLAIVREIAQQHHAQLALAETPGGGLRISVVFAPRGPGVR